MKGYGAKKLSKKTTGNPQSCNHSYGSSAKVKESKAKTFSKKSK